MKSRLNNILIFVAFFCCYFSFAQFQPTNLPNLALWLSADSSINITSGKVIQWNDLSGNGNHFTPPLVSDQPSYQFSPYLDGFAGVVFDGTDRLLSISNFSFSNATIFIVSTQNTGDASFSRLIDHSYNLGFWLGRSGSTIGGGFIEGAAPYGNFNSIQDNKPSILSLVRNGAITSYFINSIPFASPTRTTNSSPTSSNKIALGATLTGGNPGKKNIYEVVIYNTNLSNANRLAVEYYLKNKYAPPISLGQDITSTNLCSTTLTAPTGHTNLLWSTGATSSSVTVNQSGTYWVEGTDLFGYVSRDTVMVNYPVINPPLNTNICFNGSVQWNAYMGAGYTYLWNNGATTPFLNISVPGTYSVQVTDSLGCMKNSNPATFTVDTYALNVSLGADTSLCADNLINLQSGAQATINYYWNGISTSAQSPFWVVDTTGNYFVETVNINGCIAQDTIHIAITGQAPLADFSFQNQCFGLPNAFGDLSVGLPNDPVTVWHWNFGDGASETIPNPNHTYLSSGIYSVELYAESAGGCGAFHTEVLEVHNLPNASFTHLGNCEGQLVNFTNTSVPGDAPISTYLWNFDLQGTNSSTLINPSCLFMNAGNFNVSMEVSDTNGCADTVSISINVQASPSASFTVNNACEGANVIIQNNSTIVSPFSLVNHYWVYGDGTFANNPGISKQYNSYGNYSILLVETGSNGCSDSTQQNVTIYPNPDLSWTIGPACQYTYTQFTNNSTVAVGNITNTDWVVNLQFPFTTATASYSFLTTGIQYLNLTVTSDQGCMQDTLILVNVTAPLQANFTVDPSDLVADISSAFSSSSIGATNYSWDFGDGNNDNGAQVTHTYIASQIGNTLTVSLQVSNDLGCLDTLHQSYTIGAPHFDLALSNLFCQDIESYWTIGCELKNQGSITITQANLVVSLLNGIPIMETWQGALTPGESTIYVFQSHPAAYIGTQDDEISYLCIDGEGFNVLNMEDEQLTNNTICKNLETDGVVLLPIFPNPGNSSLEIQLFAPSTQNISLNLYDMQGRMIYSYSDNELLSAGVNAINIPTQQLSSGSYLLRLSDATASQIRKWVKE